MRSIPALELVPRFCVRHGRRLVLGPGKIELLERIAATGSIREAASGMEMSYMRAWTMVKSLERGFAEPLVRKIRGGQTGGGAELSETGRAIVALYREAERRSAAAVDGVAARLAAHLRR